MPGSARKFHTRHKFGKKKKKVSGEQLQGASLGEESVNEQRDGSPADAADASLTASPACDAPKRDASPAHPSPERADELCEHDCATSISADSEGIAEAPERVDGELGLAGPPVTDASLSSGAVRRDTTLLTQSELQEFFPVSKRSPENFTATFKAHGISQLLDYQVTTSALG
ncbi:hypothetical protein MRX96_053830 [Rhipicephalus microplus]